MSELRKERKENKLLKEEVKKLKGKSCKSKKHDQEEDELSKEIEEARATNIRLKIQLEEAKRTKEVLKDLLNEKEKSCQNLEIEMVDLKRKVEWNNNAHNKLQNNSIILDEILDSQKSPFDKIGLGYKREA